MISGMLSDLVNPVGLGLAEVPSPKALSTGTYWETEGKAPCEMQMEGMMWWLAFCNCHKYSTCKEKNCYLPV